MPISSPDASTAFFTVRPALLSRARFLVGESDADDLVQDALLVGARRLSENRPPEDMTSFLFGVVNVLAKKRKTTRFLDSGRSAQADTDFDQLPDSGGDPLDHLLARERGTLLDRAMARLEPDTRELLVARFVDDTPVNDLAARLSLTENTTSARLVRARESLQKTLATHLRDEAASHGLIDSARADGWTATPLICPRCGVGRLEGKLDASELSMRCPVCDRNRMGLAGFSTVAAPLPAKKVLAGARGFRIALRRVNGWWSGYIETGLRTGRAPCVHCGADVSVRACWPVSESPGFTTRCDLCQNTFHIAPAGLLLHDPIGQAFWNEHPRLRCEPPKPVVAGGADAVLVAFHDTTSSARIEAIYRKSDLALLHRETVGAGTVGAEKKI